MTKRRKINAREASLYALTKVAEEGAYANLALAEVLSAYTMDSRDRKLATEITYGVITYQLTLDWLIKQITGRPAQKLDRPVLHALRIGFYQLFYLDRIPVPAIVYSTVELIKKGKKRALASFVNGVMRGAIRKKDTLAWPDAKKNPLDYLVLRYSHPPWLVKRWLKRLGRAETEKLLVANNTTPPTSIRVNTLRTDSLQLIASLEQEKITAAPSSIVPDGLVVEKGGKLGALSAYRSGLFQIQGESAMLTSHILQPMPGAKVLDGCSAPGGKTTHLAQLMNNTGQIIALDLYEHRLALVEAAAKRLGIKIIETKCADIARFCPQNREKFDYILIDVPCSGLGVIWRKPDIKWRRQEKDIEALSQIQSQIINAAATALKPGGMLVYSTCTNEPEETNGQIERFLATHPEFVPLNFSSALPPSWADSMGSRGIHLYPHLHQVDGFFIAKLQKTHSGKVKG